MRFLTVKQNRKKQDVTSAMMYCRENKHLLHKHNPEIAREKMHQGDHHLIPKLKALLPTFEGDDDDENKATIDVGAETKECK